MKRLPLVLVLSAVLILSGLVQAYQIWAAIEIDKEMFFTVEEGEQMKQLMPKYRDWLNSYIVAIKEGMTASYKVDIWLDQRDVPIKSAYLEKPTGEKVPLKKDGPDSFEYNSNGPRDFYTSIAALELEWPSGGPYTLYITFSDGHTQSWQVMMPDYTTTPFADIVSGTLKTGANNQLILDWDTVANADEYEVWCFEVRAMRDVFEEDESQQYPHSFSTPITGAFAGKGDYNIGVDAEQTVVNGDFRVEFNSQANWFSFKKPLPVYEDKITKCTITAGPKDNDDSIAFSGQLTAIEADLLLAKTWGQPIEVLVQSGSIQMPDLERKFGVDAKSLKNGLYNSPRSSNASQELFKYDTKNHTFMFSVKNVNLTGLMCPIQVAIKIGNTYSAVMTLDETIVNGAKACPPILVKGEADTLTVDKSAFKPGKAENTDSFILSGTFTTAGPKMAGQHFRIRVGNNYFTVDDDAFIEKKPGVYTCTNAPVNHLAAAQVTATLDYTKCTYTLAVKNAAISDMGTLPVRMEAFGYTLYADKPVHFNRKPMPVLEIEISSEYDYGQPNVSDDDDEFGFGIDITTTAAVEMLEIKFPSGATYFIPNNDYGSTAPFNGGWREVASEYNEDENCYEWWYWIWFDTADDLLANMEDGLYQFTFYLPNAERLTTTVWFGIPKTNNPIPQPTHKPVFTSFDDETMLTSPVPFQWEPCTDPAVKSLWLEIYGDYNGDYEGDYEKEWVLKKTATGIRPLALKPGFYEAELDYDAWYEFKNDDGIPVEVGKYSECDYYFEVQ